MHFNRLLHHTHFINPDFIQHSPCVNFVEAKRNHWVGLCICLVAFQVIISDGREGILKFYGTTQFAEGMWCGIELAEPAGKHDGQIDGVRYFTCADRHGVFAASYKVIPANYEGSGEFFCCHLTHKRSSPALILTIFAT